jgi:hypothetical protein
MNPQKKIQNQHSEATELISTKRIAIRNPMNLQMCSILIFKNQDHSPPGRGSGQGSYQQLNPD